MNNVVHTEEALREIINSLPVAVVVIGPDKRVALVNKITEEFAQKSIDNIVGKSGGEAFNCTHHDEVPGGCGHAEACKRCGLRNTVTHTLESHEAHKGLEVDMELKGGIHKVFRISTRFIKLKDNETVLLAIEDVTDAKEQEEAKLKQMQLRTALETVGGISHELAQPLMAVLGYAELILEDVDPKDPLYQLLDAIRVNSVKLGDLVKDLNNITNYKSKEYLGSDSKIIDIKASSEGD